MSQFLETLINDVAKKTSKKCNKPEPKVVVSGTDILFNNRNLSLKISQWLTHIIRNCMDHGIEDAKTRVSQGKEIFGTINISIEQNEGLLALSIQDDGRGLNLSALSQKTGIRIDEHQKLAESVFSDGLSTAEKVTSISGREVGLSSVRGDIRAVGGDIILKFADKTQSHHQYRPFAFVCTLPIALFGTGPIANFDRSA